jgi:hypothetical protein
VTVAVFVVAVFTVLVGAFLIATVGVEGFASPPRSVMWSHVLLALVGLVVFAIGANSALAWLGVVLLLGAVGLGLDAYRKTRRQVEKRQPPNVALLMHGAAAAFIVIAAAVVAITRA